MSKAVLKVIMLGDSNVGKTSIANRYVNNTFNREYKATIGADIFQKSLWIEETEVFLQIWDTAGQERFQSLGAGYFRGADACILVYDVTNQRSFESISAWCSEFVRHASLEDVEKFPFFVLGNKSDLTERRQVRKDDADGWCKENIAGPNGEQVHFETSALNGDQVEAAFIALCKRTLDRESPVLPVYDIDRNKEALHNLDNPPKIPTPPPARGPTPPAPPPERIYIQASPPPPPYHDLDYGLQNCCGYEMNFNMTNLERRRRRRRREQRRGGGARSRRGRDRDRRDRGERRARNTPGTPEPGQSSHHDPDDINEDDNDFDEDIPAPAAPAGGHRRNATASTRRSRGRHGREKSRASHGGRSSRSRRRGDRSTRSSRSRSRRQEGELSDDSDQ